MPGQHGSALYLRWVTTNGTSVLSADYRQFSYAPSIDLIEDTAGADANKHRLVGLKDGQATLNYVHQAGGSVIMSQLDEGTEGTLEYSPEGTATGKVKYSLPAISMGANINQPYTDIIEISVTFQQNGARSVTYS
jgi:hypothetical protein